MIDPTSSPSSSASSSSFGKERLHPDLAARLVPKLKGLDGVVRILASGACKDPTLWVEIERGRRTVMEISVLLEGFKSLHRHAPFTYEILYADAVHFPMILARPVEL